MGRKPDIDEQKHYIRQYIIQDQEGHVLCQHGGIWVLQLGKFATVQTINDDIQERQH